MIRISTLLWLGLSVGTGTLLFNVSQQTQDLRAELTVMERKIALEKQSLDVLHAEWSYLNRPARLRKLAENHLDLAPIKGFPVASRENIIYFKSPQDMFPDPSQAGENVTPENMLFTNSQSIQTRLPHARPKALEREPPESSVLASPRPAARTPIRSAAPDAAAAKTQAEKSYKDRKFARSDLADKQFHDILNALEIN